MNWIFPSSLMFVSSVALYLCVRKSNELKNPQALNNLAMFLIPLIAYLIMTFSAKLAYQLSVTEYFLLLIQGVFFSYLGNRSSLKAIELAPNPGYSLIISKSYVVFTALASVLLFNSPLSIISIIAIVLIIAFSALIMIDKNEKQQESNKSWIVYTVGSFFFWGCLALSAKYFYNSGMPVLIQLSYLMSIVVIMILIEIKQKAISIIPKSNKQVFTLFLIGIFSTTFNYFYQLGIQLAPNVGLVNAANTASISLLTIMSAVLFKDHLSLKKMIGVFGVATGLVLLFI